MSVIKTSKHSENAFIFYKNQEISMNTNRENLNLFQPVVYEKILETRSNALLFKFMWKLRLKGTVSSRSEQTFNRA